MSLLGCDSDQKVLGPAPVVPPTSSTQASFLADSVTPEHGIAVSAHITGRNDVYLSPEIAWSFHPHETGDYPTSMDLLLRIDPGADAELVPPSEYNSGSWCIKVPIEVSSTGTPGEWRLRRTARTGDCECIGDWNFWSGKDLGSVHLKIHRPGTWRVEVAPASAHAFCECQRGCIPGLSFRGGTLTVPEP